MTWPRDDSQHRQILDLLADGRKHSNGEILALWPRIAQYNRVILNCREHGYDIRAVQDENDPNLWWYWLASPVARPPSPPDLRESLRELAGIPATRPVKPSSRRPARPASSGMARQAPLEGLFVEADSK